MTLRADDDEDNDDVKDTDEEEKPGLSWDSTDFGIKNDILVRDTLK